MAFEVEHLAGRLLAAVMATPYGRYGRGIREGNQRLHAREHLSEAPTRHRRAPPRRNDAPVQDAIMNMMQTNNPRLERSGLWGDKHNIYALSTFRIIRTAGNPKRQIFLSKEELASWLEPLVSSSENAALLQWFDWRVVV